MRCRIVTSILLAAGVLLGGCAEAATPVPQPTLAPPPILAATDTPWPTPLPGDATISIDNMSGGIPWLPLDRAATPLTYFFLFDIQKPPFDDVLARKAFISAIDRSALLDGGSDTYQDKTLASSFVPPQTLGRDLFNEVGIKFGPAEARAYLNLAGYEGGIGFPQVTVMAPDDQLIPLQRMADMWKTSIHVSVNLKTENERDYYQAVLATRPALFGTWWFAGTNDPDDFLRSVFRSASPQNLMGFSDPTVDRLLDEAAAASSPARRQALYVEAEQILCSKQAVVFPIFHATVDNR